MNTRNLSDERLAAKIHKLHPKSNKQHILDLIIAAKANNLDAEMLVIRCLMDQVDLETAARRLTQ